MQVKRLNNMKIKCLSQRRMRDICFVFFLYHPGPAVTAPSVVIRRSLPDLLKGDTGVLECDITTLSSSDLYVTFWADSVELPEKQFVELPKTPGPHSISRRITVPSKYLKKNTRFTCKVHQGFTSSFESNSTGNIFGERSYSSFP